MYVMRVAKHRACFQLEPSTTGVLKSCMIQATPLVALCICMVCDWLNSALCDASRPRARTHHADADIGCHALDMQKLISPQCLQTALEIRDGGWTHAETREQLRELIMQLHTHIAAELS